MTTIPLSSTTEPSPSSPIFALDCEMVRLCSRISLPVCICYLTLCVIPHNFLQCMSSKGKELTRISVIDSTHQVVYDTLVKPENPITDYLTRLVDEHQTLKEGL